MRVTLPPLLTSDGGRAILAALDADAGSTRLVGGAVRDGLLGLPVSDVDLATVFAPDEVLRRLKAAGLKGVPTGIAHGTVTAVAPSLTVEVTTLRRDVATDGRHAVVAFTDDWRADAARRDFTINALYAHAATGAVDDWFGGLDDLAAGRVRFIGEPLARIAEDHLRILRFFRFHARFGAGAPDPAGLAACGSRANDLMALSRERIRDELTKLLAAADPEPTVTTMLAHGIFAGVLPEASRGELAVLVTVEAAAGLPGDWLRRLAALLPRDAGLLERIAARLRLSTAEAKRLAAMAAPLGVDLLAEAWRAGAASVVDRLLLAGRASEVAGVAGWARPKLPASGKDLIARGVPPGPAVSTKLAAFERAWVAAEFPTDAAAVAALLDAVAAAS